MHGMAAPIFLKLYNICYKCSDNNKNMVKYRKNNGR